MPQVFSRQANLVLGLTMIALLIAVIAGIVLWRAAIARDPGINQPVEQPIPFSHKHHVGDDGLDCRYCHTSVEDSSFAGIPPTDTCMTCHSELFTDQPPLRKVVESLKQDKPIHWNRVHDLPDFVYFNHSIHVNKGVGCVSCHGQVDQMPLTRRTEPLTMQWCLSCHRDPAPHLRPQSEIFNLHWKAPAGSHLGQQLMQHYRIKPGHLTDCSTCHR